MKPIALYHERTREKLRYLARVVEACGGDGQRAARVLRINPANFTQYVTWCVTSLRRAGVSADGIPQPRFYRPPRPAHERRIKRLVPLKVRLAQFDLQWIARADAHVRARRAPTKQLPVAATAPWRDPRLTRRQAEVIGLIVGQGRSHAAAGRELGLSKSTVFKAKHAALKKLRGERWQPRLANREVGALLGLSGSAISVIRRRAQRIVNDWLEIRPRRKPDNLRSRLKTLGVEFTGDPYRRAVFDAAKTAYRQKMLTAHPDRGGAHEAAAALNKLWATVEAAYTRRNKYLEWQEAA